MLLVQIGINSTRDVWKLGGGGTPCRIGTNLPSISD